ncbi:DNA-methyltransferase [Geminicoccus flavidas]|uniref:DNA-methyltransferase n=1 Tax=Geminicoccus flavidas TaxID=2506407 RepID=UPI00190F70AD|nr:site-specific DNA-methyltransferase [Geminicoccus flavidas]
MADASVDAIVTDPPYGIRFMGMAWDDPDIVARTEQRRSMRSHAPAAGPNGGHKSIAAEAGKYDLSPAAMRAFQDWTAAWCREAMRVLKPGGHMLVFASARTYHRMACGVEEAGFELRDQIMWLYGSGFPKSHNLDGAWEGWGTALKPAHEPICVARKPLVSTVAANVLAYGTGAINIDACRVPTDEVLRAGAGGIPCRNDPMVPRGRSGEASATRRYAEAGVTDFAPLPGPRGGDAAGRWPANVIHDGSPEVVAAFPQASGAQSAVKGTEASAKTANTFGEFGGRAPSDRRDGGGSAARFYYCAKASRADRNAGCEALESKPLNWSSGTQNPGSFQSAGTDRNSQNHHPTVKPTDLMAYLCRLVTPPGGLVLDPFMGSGSTGKACMREGFRFVGIELSDEYLAIAQARIEHELAAATAAQAAAFNPQLGLFGEAA